MNDNNTNLLNFPIQLDYETPGIELADDDLACQVRMMLVKKLNYHLLGKYSLTEEDKEAIETANTLFLKYGYQTIDFDRSQF